MSGLPLAPQLPFPLWAARPADQATRAALMRLSIDFGGRLIGAATAFLLASALGVSEFGRYVALSGLALILAEVADAGLLAVSVPWLATGDCSLRGLVRARLLPTLGLAVVACALFGEAPVFALLLLAAILAGWVEFLAAAQRGHGKPWREALVLLLLRCSSLAGACVGLQVGGDLQTVCLALLVAMLPAALMAALFARALPDTGVHLAVSRIWRRSWPLALNGLLARASLRVELLVLLAFRGSFEAGLFGVALKLIEPLGAVPAAIGSGALRQLAQEGRRASHDVRTRAVALAAGCGVPAALGLGLLAPGLLQWLGEGYAAALTPLRWLALAVGVMFINAILLHALLALDRGALLARLTAARLLAAGALALLLTPLAGATGAALGFLASEVLLLWLALRACAGAGFPIAVVRPLQSALACSLPMAAVTAVAPLPLPALVVLGVAVYAVTLALAWRGRARAGNC